MFAVLCSDGAITPEHIVGQLRDEQWVPLAVTKPRNIENPTPTLLTFNNQEIAKKFARRNFPKDWLVSVVQLADDDQEWIKEKGWLIKNLTYPQLMNTHPDYELTYEILTFKTRPDVGIVRGSL
jgi:hypothetical protein